MSERFNWNLSYFPGDSGAVLQMNEKSFVNIMDFVKVILYLVHDPNSFVVYLP